MAAELSAHLSGSSGPPPPRINIAYNANNTVTLTWNAAGFRLTGSGGAGFIGQHDMEQFNASEWHGLHSGGHQPVLPADQPVNDLA
jgi:hypothetical protein